MTELWRVAVRLPHTPAHAVGCQNDRVLVTSCGWAPKQPGVVITRAEMLKLGAFVCRCCAKKVVAR
jgi:hypothetical protein